MRKLIVLLFVQILTSGIHAQNMSSFSGSTIENKRVRIPEDTKGKYTVLCFVASKQALQTLEPWLNPIYNKYIAKTGIMDSFFDVNVYLVPVFSSANKSVEGMVKRKFREEVQKDVWPHVLFCEADPEPLIKNLNMHNEQQPYFFLMNSDNKIIYKTSGVYTEEKFDEIDDLIE